MFKVFLLTILLVYNGTARSSADLCSLYFSLKSATTDKELTDLCLTHLSFLFENGLVGENELQTILKSENPLNPFGASKPDGAKAVEQLSHWRAFQNILKKKALLDWASVKNKASELLEFLETSNGRRTVNEEATRQLLGFFPLLQFKGVGAPISGITRGGTFFEKYSEMGRTVFASFDLNKGTGLAKILLNNNHNLLVEVSPTQLYLVSDAVSIIQGPNGLKTNKGSIEIYNALTGKVVKSIPIPGVPVQDPVFLKTKGGSDLVFVRLLDRIYIIDFTNNMEVKEKAIDFDLSSDCKATVKEGSDGHFYLSGERSGSFPFDAPKEYITYDLIQGRKFSTATRQPNEAWDTELKDKNGRNIRLQIKNEKIEIYDEITGEFIKEILPRGGKLSGPHTTFSPWQKRSLKNGNIVLTIFDGQYTYVIDPVKAEIVYEIIEKKTYFTQIFIDSKGKEYFFFGSPHDSSSPRALYDADTGTLIKKLSIASPDNQSLEYPYLKELSDGRLVVFFIKKLSNAPTTFVAYDFNTGVKLFEQTLQGDKHQVYYDEITDPESLRAVVKFDNDKIGYYLLFGPAPKRGGR